MKSEHETVIWWSESEQGYMKVVSHITHTGEKTRVTFTKNPELATTGIFKGVRLKYKYGLKPVRVHVKINREVKILD